MSVFSDIANALNKRLLELPLLPPVAWENAKFTPTNESLYIAPFLLPAATSIRTLGYDENSTGVYQVSIYSKKQSGTKDALIEADRVSDHFKSDRLLSSTSGKINILSVSRSPAIFTDDRYLVAVSISYRLLNK